MAIRTPTYIITANQVDITATIQGRLIDLTVTDCRGFESDELTLTVDDHDAKVEWISRGVELQVWLGYVGEPLHYQGKFVVDEAGHGGPPDKITVRAKAPDVLAKFKGAKTRSFDKATVGAIVKTLADDNQLTAACSPTLAAQKVEHIDQTQESDLHFLTRLGERWGAVAKIADGKLIFTEAGKATSVSGKALPVAAISRAMIDTHTYTEAGRGDYTGVEAVWHDVRAAKKRKATASAAEKPKKKTTRKVLPPQMVVTNEEEIAGSADNVKRLKQTFPDEATAKAAAEAEWMRLQRAKATLELDIKVGLPQLKAETRCPVAGIRPWIDGDWIATEVSHTLSDTTGLSSRAKLERPDDYNAEEDET